MAEMHKLDVPFRTTRDVKNNPGRVFETADQWGSGVYVLNHHRVIGVMVTQEQYEALLGANHIVAPKVQREPKTDDDDVQEIDMLADDYDDEN
jgi:hypothetical protein